MNRCFCFVSTLKVHSFIFNFKEELINDFNFSVKEKWMNPLIKYFLMFKLRLK